MLDVSHVLIHPSFPVHITFFYLITIIWWIFLIGTNVDLCHLNFLYCSCSNGFQKLDKVKDSNRQSKQLEELTGKMRECKRSVSLSQLFTCYLVQYSQGNFTGPWAHPAISLCSISARYLTCWKLKLNLSVKATPFGRYSVFSGEILLI